MTGRAPFARLSRRAALAGGAGLLAAPALGQDKCALGPPPHERGPLVFRNYDQVELDAAYDQDAYQPHTARVNDRLAMRSYDARARLGAPIRAAYGSAAEEGLDYWPGPAGGPVFVFVHGGVWQHLSAADAGFAAEPFVRAGAHFVALDFANVRNVGGDLGVLADQVRRGIAWTWANAARFGGDPGRLYLGGFSSGGHLAAMALTADWTSLGGPPDLVKGAVLMSGLYDMEPVRLSWRGGFIAFTDAMAAEMSPQRRIERVSAPVIVTVGSLETPEFQRQSAEFAAALEEAGKPVEIIWGESCFHQDMMETLGNPYDVNGRAALVMMGLASA